MPSSVVATTHYDPAKKTLRIVYTSGAVYDYLKVPDYINEEMKNAFSKGTFLNTRIKGIYPFKKIK